MNVIDRFLNYVAFPTTSDEASETDPSSARQLALAEALAAELKELGLADAGVDGFGRVYAHLPATPGREEEPTIGLIAHMDTSPDASGEHICHR